jgi:preprotein translocase subunit SecG
LYILIILLHIAVCIALILIVLLQTGKGADMGAAFGGSSQTVFGSSGASSFLSKVTIAAAVIFLFTSLTLAFLFGKGATSSIMEGVSQPQAPITQGTEAPVPAPAPTGNQPEQ